MIEAPPEVKEEIEKRLKENGTIAKLEKSVLDALNVAAKEVSTKSTAPSSLEHRPMKSADENTMIALEAIYQFLKERELDFTLKCLEEETGVKQTDKYGKLDICKILEKVNEDEGENNDFLAEKNNKNVEDEEENEVLISNSSDGSFLEIDNEDDDEKPEPKKVEKPVEVKKPVEEKPAVNAFVETEIVRNIPPPITITKTEFEINDKIYLVSNL